MIRMAQQSSLTLFRIVRDAKVEHATALRGPERKDATEGIAPHKLDIQSKHVVDVPLRKPVKDGPEVSTNQQTNWMLITER